MFLSGKFGFLGRKSLVIHLVGMLILIYFTYHLITGERGVKALIVLNAELSKTTEELEMVRAERLQLEHKVNLMRPESLDLDLLDQQVRLVLGYARKNEIVILEEK